MFFNIFAFLLCAIALFFLIDKVTELYKHGYGWIDIFWKVAMGIILWPVTLFLLALVFTMSVPIIFFGLCALIYFLLDS